MLFSPLESATWLFPLFFILAGLISLRSSRPQFSWTVASVTSVAATLTLLLVWLEVLLLPSSPTRSPDFLGLVMVSLVTILALVIIRYSRRYLEGEPNQPRYVSALLLTLAAVFVVVLSDNLAVLAVAWCATSVGLHRLLTFYSDRPAALVAAHKKFIASRAADLCLLIALALIYFETGSLQMSAIASSVEGLTVIPTAFHTAMFLLALAVVLRSAQLPVHGWLMQVMEAPTPVSALLHAGVINLGGFVLIRLAEALALTPAAQALLVFVGSSTAVVAGLVMMTRISIKVRLAWSTCAQMGFMLMECGLGLFDLALLHLVAHSLYKAYAFLTAGEAVLTARRAQMASHLERPTPLALLTSGMAAPIVSVGIVLASLSAWHIIFPSMSVPAVVILILTLAVAPFLWPGTRASSGFSLRSCGCVFAIVQVYCILHLAFAALVQNPPMGGSTVLAAWAGGSFLLLYALQLWLRAFPQGTLSQTLYPWVYAGFFLDERFTRLTFKLWPLRMPESSRTELAFELSAMRGQRA